MSTKKLPFDPLLVEKILSVNLGKGGDAFTAAFLQELEGGAWQPDMRSAIDRLLLDRGFKDPSPLKFFAETYERAKTSASTALGKASPEVVEYISEQCVAQAGICVAYPEMFPQTASKQEAAAFFIAEGLARSFSDRFFHALIEQLKTLGVLQSVGMKILYNMMESAAANWLIGEAGGPVQALNVVSVNRTMLKVLFESSYWRVLGSPGEVFQRYSFLGPFFSFSPLPDTPEGECTAGKTYFREAIARRMDIESELSSVRVMTDGLQTGLKNVLVNLLKPEEDREFVLQWIADACSKNVARNQSGHGLFNRPRTSSEGFVVNLFQVLVRLCKPFIDPGNDPKNLISKIDPTFYLSKHRLDLSKETKLASSDEDVARWVDPRNLARIKQAAAAAAAAAEREKATGAAAAASAGEDGGAVNEKADENEELEVSSKFGTISEYFFLTLWSMHALATEKLMKDYGKLNEALYEIQNQWKAAGGDGGALASASAHELETSMNVLFERKFCYDAVYTDPNFCNDLLSFSRLVCVWLMRLARAPAPQMLPLPLPPPKLFVSLPEPVLESVANAVIFVIQINPSAFESLMKQDLHDLTTAFVAFASSPTHVRNPYLRGKLVQILSYLVPSERRFTRNTGFVSSLFHDSTTFKKYLMPLLVRFYVDIEVTGSHTQFYDKFQYRHCISVLFRYLWDIPEYKEAMKLESKKESFVRFLNMLINDITWCVDESLTKLQEIRNLELDKPNWARLTEQEQKEKKQLLKSSRGQCRWTMQNANESLDLMAMITSGIVDPFMTSELRDRTAATLNYVLVQIAGPKCMELKVKKPEKVSFKPKELLGQIFDIYVHLSVHSQFAGAVARDGRSFDKRVFHKAVHIIRSNRLREEFKIDKFLSVAAGAEEELMKEADLTEILGDVPDDFLDPITCDIIRDPVRLPGSGHVMDRSSIARHVLSDETNPFNREFLSAEMVKNLETDADLLRQITEFIEKRKADFYAKKKSEEQKTDVVMEEAPPAAAAAAEDSSQL